MKLLLAILLPWLHFFTLGRLWSGAVCLLLQLTLIGWLPAAIWAVYTLMQDDPEKERETDTPAPSAPTHKIAEKAPASNDGGDGE